jgi:hypothetical protein
VRSNRAELPAHYHGAHAARNLRSHLVAKSLRS